MAASTSTYSVELDERYIYRVDVLATSFAEALKKVNAFYARQRTPVTKYQERELTAVLLSGSADTPRQFVKGWTSPFSVKLDERYVSMYSMEVHEQYAYDVKVIAPSAADALKKVNAFYARQRKPETKYQQVDLTASLVAKSVRRRRCSSSWSAWMEV